MNIDRNARLTPIRREEMARTVVSGLLTKAKAARGFGVSSRIVSRWPAPLWAAYCAADRGFARD